MINATLVGCGIGDALGVPWEFQSSKKHVHGKTGSGSLADWDGMFKDGATFRKHNKAGEWSDDTIASVCLAKSLLECKGFDPENVAQKYLEWYQSEDFRGMGSTTAHAISRLKQGRSWKESGLVGDEFGGNGSVMRYSPISIYFRHDIDKLVETAITDAMITHNNKEPKIASVAAAFAGAWIAVHPKPANKLQLMTDTIECAKQLGKSVVLSKLEEAYHHLQEKTEPYAALKKIGTSGWAPHTAAAALYCFCKTDSFQEGVVMAIKCGGDTDSTAAVCGALAGTYYGLEAIPQVYKDGVEDFAGLTKLDQELWEAGKEKAA